MGPFSVVWNMDLVLLSQRSGRVRDQGLPWWAREERDVPISLGSRRAVCQSLGLNGTWGCHQAPGPFHPETDQPKPGVRRCATARGGGCSCSATTVTSVWSAVGSQVRWTGGFSVLGSELEIQISSNWRLPLAILVYAGVFPWQQSGDTGCPGTGTGFIYYRSCMP